MNVILREPNGQSLVSAHVDKHDSVVVPVSLTREVHLSRTLERKPGEGEYAAFFVLGPYADKHHEFDKVFGDMTRDERIMAAVFHGAEVEPELPTEVVNLDGVSVIQIDLDKQFPGAVMLVPESYVPAAQ